ncbi:MAG: GH1 family beta-glucosidase [Planctomycetota bacterium]
MFPDGFLWGVASSAYQIEGGAAADGRTPSVWDSFSQQPGAVVRGESGAVACDHFERYLEDVDLMGELGVGAYRFSVSWPRVIPDGVGSPSADGLAFYDRLVDALLERSIQPWCTLYHWDMPEALFRKGGWLNRESADWFADYAALLADRLGDRVANWMTLNEPQVYVHHGHTAGIHAPGMRYDAARIVPVIHHSLLAHGRATQALRSFSRGKATIGWAPVGETRIPHTNSPDDIEAACDAMFRVEKREGWEFNNSWFSDPAVLGEYPADGLKHYGTMLPDRFERDLEIIRQPLDFYGVNIYQAPRIGVRDGSPSKIEERPGEPRTRFGWPVTPEALYWGPKFLHDRYQLPMYITENGLSSMDWVHLDGKVHDAGRIDFLHRYLRELERAVSDGVDVRGYFQWSILDNFEWAAGYDQRFGLVHVDFETGVRIPKDSYHWYRSVIAENALPS